MGRLWCGVLIVALGLAAGPFAARAQDKPVQTNPPSGSRSTSPFELLDGDRVAFVGDTLIERAQANDYLETFLTVRWPDRNVIFRNLGWSGDDVTGESRAGFGTAEDGFKQLRQQVTDFKPTVIFVAYGANASYSGEKGLAAFEAGYKRLLDMLAETKATLILLSPIPQEDVGRPLPDPKVFNEYRRTYSTKVLDLARARGCRFIDLFHYVSRDAVLPNTVSAPSGTVNFEPPFLPRPDEHLTDNGIHLTATGYWRLAQVITQQLDWAPHPKLDTITVDSRTKAEGFLATWNTKRAQLPTPPVPGHPETELRLQVKDLPAGEYSLTIDGQLVKTASAAAWAAGQVLPNHPETKQVEELRKTILAKNQLFFHRWRPQNETYLFGFRKHEQGQNAKEIPMFDPLIEAKEKEIARLRKPVEHRYELKTKS